MSMAVISYRSLEDAADEAGAVAKKLDQYISKLKDGVAKKLEAYDGRHTENIQTAIRKTALKAAELETASSAYARYGEELKELGEACERTDAAVKLKISQLTAAFKESHGIKNSKVQNTVNFFLTSLKNAQPAGRWIGNAVDRAVSGEDYVRQSIKSWWNYDGGRQFVPGALVGAIEVAVGVCTIINVVAAVIAGGWTVALAAALVCGVIAVIHGMVNMANEGRGLREAWENEDPALGRRRSEEDTVQDCLRRETDKQLWHNCATGIDVVNFVCAAVSIVDSAGKLVKNVYKWATGSMADLNNLRIRNILNTDSLRQLAAKLRDTAAGGVGEIKTAFRTGDFQTIGEFFFDFGDDFVCNLKKSYFNFDSLSKMGNYTAKKDQIKALSDAAKSAKAILSIPKALLKEGFTFQNVVVDIGLFSVVLPNMNMGEVVTYRNRYGGGVLDYEVSAMRMGDVRGLLSDIKSKIFGNRLFRKSDSVVPEIEFDFGSGAFPAKEYGGTKTQ